MLHLKFRKVLHCCAGAAALVAGLATAPLAHAQKADQNAVTSADDAFGNRVGLESTGIYTDRNTRGFSPLDAGNVRIDGIYFDQVTTISGRLRDHTAIRVGFGAIDFPFVAPTGVVDNRFNPMPTEAGNSVELTKYNYGGHLETWDLRLPLVQDHLGLTGGFANASTPQADGTDLISWGVTLRPIVKVAGIEFAPFISTGDFQISDAKPLAVIRDGFLPKVPKSGKYLGQDWATGSRRFASYGATLRARLTDRLSFRGGAFRSQIDKKNNFSEIYRIVGEGGKAQHFVFADPRQDVHSTSGEGLIGYRFGNDANRHVVFGGYRMRNRYTETGGSDFLNITAAKADLLGVTTEEALATYGERDLIDKPEFEFGEVNRGRIRQSSWMMGYLGRIDGLGHVNFGLQKARYRASRIDGVTNLRETSSADPWLYNATVMAEISPHVAVYVATQRGLEDSGLAPENAANRNAQLPATKTTQYEGGVRLGFGRSHLVLSAFQIEKPYFSFDSTNTFVAIGTRRHRGLEASLAGHFGDRFDVVAGAVYTKAQVTGDAVSQGLVGKRPAGTPDLFVQVDANYRTDILGGLTLTGGFDYTGKVAATARPVATRSGQIMLPGWISLNAGLRNRFKLGKTDMSLRASLRNILDSKAWNVVAADVIAQDNRRRLLVTLAADF